jgi:hypothetical protein
VVDYEIESAGLMEIKVVRPNDSIINGCSRSELTVMFSDDTEASRRINLAVPFVKGKHCVSVR